MTDGVIAGTGNSRYLKSAISEDMTWEEYRALLRSGSLPIDFNGFNAAGWTQIGTPLNKANLLADSTVTALESALGIDLPSNATINDVLLSLAVTPIKIATGAYTGTGTYGSENRTSVSVGFTPKLFYLMRQSEAQGSKLISINPMTRMVALYGSSGSACPITWGTTVSWYNTTNAANQMNTSGDTYYWFAIG